MHIAGEAARAPQSRCAAAFRSKRRRGCFLRAILWAALIFAVGQGLATAGVAAEISPDAATAAAAAEAAANAAFFEARSSVKPEKRVFAHYMLCCGSFGSSVEAYVQDIRIAQAMGLDGFALNAGGWGDNYRESAAHMFAAAERICAAI